MSHSSAHAALLEAAAGYLGAYPEAPWGHLVFKVDKKIFIFANRHPEPLSISLKLPGSAADALQIEGAVPMGYGMGKHGWVSFNFPVEDEPPIADLLEWLEESYRSVAKKTTISKWDAGGRNPPPREPAPPTGEHVLLIGNDDVRLARAERELAAEGVTCMAVGLDDALSSAHDAGPDLLVVDCSRDLGLAQGVLAELAGTVLGIGRVATGIRDAKTERKLRDADRALTCSREAPGDPKAVATILGVLRR